MSVWDWAEHIHPVAPEHRITLGEGRTPLIPSRVIGPQAGAPNLHFKLESCNPTGSFKDRFAAVAISEMQAQSQTVCIATSSGNTGAALAAYCAAAPEMQCRIAVVETAPGGKLRQMRVYGADVLRIRQFGLDAQLSQKTFDRLDELAKTEIAALQVSSYIYSAPGMTGVETLSLELNEQAKQLGLVDIDHVFCPAGGGGLCIAMVYGYRTLKNVQPDAHVPAIECVQPIGNDTMATPLRERRSRAQEVQCSTHISGLQVPSINDGHLVVEGCPTTGGTGHLVEDEDVWNMQRRLATEEGIFCEPAAAVSVVGALNAVAAGEVNSDANIVCLVTGSGFKDEASVDRMLAEGDCPLIEWDELSLPEPS